MSTLRVDKIKGCTGTTVTIPDSQNLAVTGNVTVSGQQDFASGAQLNLQGINVNTGSRGDILYYDANGKIAKLNVGASGAVLKSDGTDVSWGAIGGAPNIYYVATNGTDAAGRGGSVDTAWKTVKYACSNIGTPTATSPAIIFIKGGVYEETSLPIIIPPFTTITGDSLRTTVIKPGAGLDSGGSILNTRSTLFRCSNGVIVQDLVCDGMGGYVVGSPGHDPTVATLGGVYFALNSASVIVDKSPYIYNVTTFGDGATGAYIDGALHGSGYRTMLFHTYTAIHSDGLGIWAKDNGAAEVINCFTYYAQLGYCSTGGAQVRSLNSSNSYGEYGVFSKGYDSSESANQGAVVGTLVKYIGVITTAFEVGEQITGGTSGATANVANVQSEPKTIYIVNQSGTFQASETITGGTSGASIVLDAGAGFAANQSGRILITTFGTAPDVGDSVQFATTDGNAYQIQSISTETISSTNYKILVFSTSRPTPVASGVVVNCRKRFSTVRLTGHDFLKIGTGDKTTTNWPGTPTQAPSQADQIISNSTDPGRVYYVATDELGNFYVGDYFKVDQATGNVTLDASAFNLQGLQTLQLGAIGGLIGAAVNEFSTDGTMSQNSNVKCPTQAAVVTYVGANNAVTPTGGTFAITGNLSVTGTTTTVNTANTTISDKLLELGTGTTGAPSGDIGIILERGDSNNAFIGFDESEDKFTLATTAATGGATGDLTLTTGTLVANLEGTVTGNASSATVATAVTVTDESSDTTCYPLFADGATGNLSVRSGTNLTFNSSTGDLTAGGTVSDSKGDLRQIPINFHNAATYTLVASDAGKVISENSSGANITIPAGVFSGGDAITIMNHTGGNITLTKDSGFTMYNSADGTNANRTLGSRGFCTIFYREQNVAYISGAGLT